MASEHKAISYYEIGGKTIMVINGKMSISFPESFLPLDQATREKMHFYVSEPEVCLQDKERHMIVIMNHQQLPLISRMMLKDKEVVSSLEKSCAQAMKNFDYSLVKFMSQQIDGKMAYGFRYIYTAEAVPMEGECFTIRDGKLLYNLYVYYRKLLRDDSVSKWESIMDSIKWVKA